MCISQWPGATQHAVKGKDVLASGSSELLKKEEGRQVNKKQTQDSRTGASCMELGSHLNVACDVYKEETGQWLKYKEDWVRHTAGLGLAETGLIARERQHIS